MPIKILQHNWKLVSSGGQVAADVANRLKPVSLFVFFPLQAGKSDPIFLLSWWGGYGGQAGESARDFWRWPFACCELWAQASQWLGCFWILWLPCSPKPNPARFQFFFLLKTSQNVRKFMWYVFQIMFIFEVLWCWTIWGFCGPCGFFALQTLTQSGPMFPLRNLTICWQNDTRIIFQ